MNAMGGPKMKLWESLQQHAQEMVSMIALGGPKLKRSSHSSASVQTFGFNDSTGWA